MNPLKKGPTIKRPELRVPDFLADLYYDLQDRHLLPVVVLLLVGIVAVPILLGGSSEEAEPAAVATPATAPARTSSLVVSEEEPELRSYKHRLSHLTAKDPFVQRLAEEESSEAEANASESESGESGAEAETEVSPSEREGSAPAESGGATAPAPTTKTRVFYFTYALDVRVVPVSVDGKPSKAEPYVRKDLPPLTMLPSRETPALTYLSPSKDGKKALMLVSDKVTSIFGDSLCVVGSEACQLLALEPGVPETVVYGANDRTYRIELLKIKVETTDHLNRAPLGKPKHGHGSSAN